MEYKKASQFRMGLIVVTLISQVIVGSLTDFGFLALLVSLVVIISSHIWITMKLKKEYALVSGGDE